MKKSCEGIGRNIEQAISNALFELKATREDVDIKILEEGGFFKKAKVLVTISEDAIEKYEQREERRQEELNNACSNPKCECETCTCGEECSCGEECQCDDGQECTSECDIKEEKEESYQKTNTNGKTDLENCKEFVEGFLENAQIGAGVSYEETDEDIKVKIEGEKAASLIGYRGDSINALQYLISVYVAKNNRHAKKIRLDINGFREKREQTLISLAERIAKKVAKTKHQCKLEPMPANERRIIHLALQSSEEVVTESKGQEPKRYLIIKPKD